MKINKKIKDLEEIILEIENLIVEDNTKAIAKLFPIKLTHYDKKHGDSKIFTEQIKALKKERQKPSSDNLMGLAEEILLKLYDEKDKGG